MIITRLINIFSNGGMYFITPLVGTTLAQAPSIEVALYTMTVGLILSACREGFDHVRERERKRHE